MPLGTLKKRLIRGDSTTEAAWSDGGTLVGIQAVNVGQLVPATARLVVVAPHPDDEILMAGGLLQHCRTGGRAPLIVAVTDGEASHPKSSLWPASRLQRERPRESETALARLGLHNIETQRLGFADGSLHTRGVDLEHALALLIEPSDVVLTTWRLDGHPDHDACGIAGALAARAVGATLIEVPVWMWHWSAPGDPRVPWAQARRLPLSAEQVKRKQQAIGAFRSQLTPDVSTGAAPVLLPSILARITRGSEFYFVS